MKLAVDVPGLGPVSPFDGRKTTVTVKLAVDVPGLGPVSPFDGRKTTVTVKLAVDVPGLGPVSVDSRRERFFVAHTVPERSPSSPLVGSGRAEEVGLIFVEESVDFGAQRRVGVQVGIVFSQRDRVLDGVAQNLGVSGNRRDPQGPASA